MDGKEEENLTKGKKSGVTLFKRELRIDLVRQGRTCGTENFTFHSMAWVGGTCEVIEGRTSRCHSSCWDRRTGRNTFFSLEVMGIEGLGLDMHLGSELDHYIGISAGKTRVSVRWIVSVTC